MAQATNGTTGQHRTTLFAYSKTTAMKDRGSSIIRTSCHVRRGASKSPAHLF
jgi:hypothetical protein